MIFSQIRKNNLYPCKPKFYFTEVGFKGVKMIYACFRDVKFLFLTSTSFGALERLCFVILAFAG